MQVVVDSLLTHYATQGSGKRHILLLHGWGDSLQTFSELSSTLAKKYTVVSLDLPGFGDTQMPSEVWGLSDYAVFVHNFLEKMNIKDLTVLVAHSNGAAVAIKGLASGALEAEKLVLIGAAGIRDKQKIKKLGLKVIAKTGKFATFWLPSKHKKKLQKKLYGVVGSDMLTLPHMQETFKKTVSEDVQKDATKVNIPTLLIYGADDRATPPLYGELFKQLIPGSSLELVPKAGHFVHRDQPEQTRQLIEEFIK